MLPVGYKLLARKSNLHVQQSIFFSFNYMINESILFWRILKKQNKILKTWINAIQVEYQLFIHFQGHLVGRIKRSWIVEIKSKTFCTVSCYSKKHDWATGLFLSAYLCTNKPWKKSREQKCPNSHDTVQWRYGITAFHALDFLLHCLKLYCFTKNT